MRLSGSDCSHTRPGPVQRREEEAFTAEQRRLDAADELDVVVDARLQRHQAARCRRAASRRREIEVLDGAAGVHEAQAVAFELLHDEALAAEQADAELLLERDADRDAAGRAQERVLLADEMSAERARSIGMILPGYGAANATFCLPWPWLVNTVMNRLSPVSMRLPAPSSASITPPLLLAAVAEDGLHLDALRHVHHRAGFGDGAFARIELDFDELHLVAVDLEVDVVRAAARRRRWRERPPPCAWPADALQRP